MARTLVSLRTAVLNQADMADSSFIDTTQLTYWINAELGELHALLVSSYEDYLVSTDTITLDGSASYSLASDFYKALKVFLVQGTTRYRLHRFSMDGLAGEYTQNRGNEFMSYRIMGDLIYLDPTPSATGSLLMYYAPQFTMLVADDSVVNVAVPIAWEDFVVSGVTARCLAREESDPTYFLQRKEMLRRQFIEEAPNRDAGEPSVMGDHYRRFISETDI